MSKFWSLLQHIEATHDEPLRPVEREVRGEIAVTDTGYSTHGKLPNGVIGDGGGIASITNWNLVNRKISKTSQMAANYRRSLLIRPFSNRKPSCLAGLPRTTTELKIASCIYGPGFCNARPRGSS